MSNSPNFFVQGRIEKDTDVYIVAKTEISGGGTNLTPSLFGSTNGITSGNTMWSVLGAQQNYTPYEDLLNVVYYYYDGTNYHYPLFVNKTGDHNNAIHIGQNGKTMTLYYSQDQNTTTPPESTFRVNGTEYYYKNAKTLVNLPLSLNGNITNVAIKTPNSNSTTNVTKNGYFYPAYLNNTDHRSTINYNQREFYIPYGVVSSDKENKTQDPKPVENAEAKLILYNPYQSVMNNLFRIEQSSTQNQGIKLSLSSSIGNPSVKKFKNVRLDDNKVLTCSNTGESQFFNFKPQGVKIDNRNIYAGVGYKLNPSDNINSSPSFNIVSNVTRNIDIIKEAGIEYSPDSIPNSNSFLISSDPFSYDSTSFDLNSTTNKNTQGTPLSDTELPIGQVNGENTTLYFIPYQMYQVSTNSRSEYTGYDPIQFLISSPQVFNLRPKILHGSLASGNTNYFKWVNEVRISSDPSELAFTTKGHDAHTKIVTRYCNTNEFCGKCFGVCNPKNTLNPSNLCILDTESVSEFNKGEDYFTCDHDRYVNSSDYVKNGTISHHSNSFILILIILAIVIGAGIILFEERKMILKHVLSTKNGR